MKYLSGYPEAVLAQVRQLLAQNRLGELLRSRYPARHDIRSDKALFDYVQGLKAEYLRNGEYGGIPEIKNDVFMTSLLIIE